jgi:hypothetical protein
METAAAGACTNPVVAIALLTSVALHSRLSAGSCFWRGGQQEARQLFESLANANPAQATEIKQLAAEIAADYPARDS